MKKNPDDAIPKLKKILLKHICGKKIDKKMKKLNTFVLLENN